MSVSNYTIMDASNGVKMHQCLATADTIKMLKPLSRHTPWSFLKGFTLLEVLVAISILAICIVGIFQVFISCFDARLRVENYGKTVVISSDALEYADEYGVPLNSEELTEDIRRFDWQFTQNDIDVELYPKLKEIVLDTTWEQGKRKGQFSLTTYYWNPQ